MKGKARKGGRPARQPEPGERVPLGLRVTPEIKERLDSAARESGRSQSQEAEFRLEQSFRDEDLLPQLMEATYSAQLAGVLRILGRTIAATANHATWRKDGSYELDWNWLQEPWAFDQVSKAVEQVMKAIAPDGDPDATPHGEFGVTIARDLLSIVSRGHPSEDIQRWVESVNKSIGRDLSKRIKQRLNAPYFLGTRERGSK